MARPLDFASQHPTTDESRSTTETILEKVRKLMRHAESARRIGSADEAAAFAGKAADLMAAHKIEEGTVALDGDAPAPEAVTKERYEDDARSRIAWKTHLAWACGRGAFCKFVVDHNRTSGTFFGRPSDILVAKYLLGMLIDTCDRLAASYPGGRAEKNDFRNGFAMAIHKRMKERADAQDAPQTGNALMLRTARQQVQDYMTSIGFQTTNVHLAARTHTAAFQHGKEAGNRQPLHSAVRSGGHGARQIGG